MKRKMLTIILALALALSISLPAFAGPIEDKLETNSCSSGIGFGVKATTDLVLPAQYTVANGKVFELVWVEAIKEKGIKYYWVIYLAEE